MTRIWPSIVVLIAMLLSQASAGTIAARDPGVSASVASAASGKDGDRSGHNKPLPAFVQKKEGERVIAADLVAKGQAAPDADGIVTLRNGKAVRYRLQGEEYLTVALIDFSDVQHGQLAQPDRSVDNSTYWSADVSPQHYYDMLFSDGGASYGRPSMRDFYLELSSGRFTWTGQVGNWVNVGVPESEFGADTRGGGTDDANGATYRVVDYTLKAIAASGNYAGLDLAKADVIDRYDCDGDGVFAEPDGYIDHFGIAHAGEGQEAGGGAQGTDAIWSHRWYANFNQTSGPSGCQLGGYNLPGTDLWVGDYTIQPENGGVGVFAHEFGHDLGLPDLYDTAGGDNGTGFWTLMSSGSWASDSADSIGDKPVHMGAWEKLLLGWLGDDLARVALGADTTVDLGPAEGATRNRAQALRVDLPNYTRTTTVFPVDGSDANYYYSGKGDDIDHSMTKAVSLVAATPISFRAMWDIEKDWDYAYLRAQVNGVWTNVATSASTTTSPNGQNFGFGITGASGGWVTVTATLPAGTTAYGFRYWTDAAVVNPGFAVDSIAIGATVDDATVTTGWSFNGFMRLTNGQFSQSYFHYYLAEARSYIGNDSSLCGAYNFLSGNWLEKQCYADGVLISYRNSGYTDNNTSQHPGFGQILPIDAHPATMVKPDGRTVWRSRWQVWDATFGVDSNSVTLSQWISPGRKLSRTYTSAPVTQFYDSSTTAYYNSAIPYSSVKTAGSGLKIDITGVSTDRGSYRLHIYR
ncbi:MAG TPA: immune inhibitor A domain-containing protein [Candidatus Limnocylindria bacterium]|nr:immune inhibitor A domain-containing protein [Candidatus Limnocylindria bacterium]